MATLQENIDKVIAAANSLKAGLSEKGVSVPSNIKLGDLVDLAKSNIGEYINSVNFSNAPATVLLTSNIIRSDLSKAESLRFMFSDNDALESISLPAGCGAEAKSVEYAFANCMSLTSLSIPEEFGQNAENANDCFSSSGLQSITLPAKFGQKATQIAGCFSVCQNLTSLALPSAFGQNATNIGQCFASCSSLSSLALPAKFGQVATAAYQCFMNCSKLTSLSLPSGFCQNATNLQSMFSGCTSLKTLNFGTNSQFGAKVTTATNANYCFGRLTALESITGAIKIPVSFSLSECPNLTHDSLMNVINGLATVATEQTLTLGTTNLAKLSEEEQQIAKDKGWKLA